MFQLLEMKGSVGGRNPQSFRNRSGRQANRSGADKKPHHVEAGFRGKRGEGATQLTLFFRSKLRQVGHRQNHPKCRAAASIPPRTTNSAKTTRV
jgi:hypothetical protein